MTTPDAPMFAAADRNKDAILDVLREVLPQSGSVLEIASGGGQHVHHFASELPGLQWLPSDADGELVSHLDAAVREGGRANLLAPVELDVCAPAWTDLLPQAGFDAIISANMIHIAPWAACTGLLAGAAQLLEPGGLVCFYGPFSVDGEHTSSGNADFDRSLRAQNPGWGLRDVSEVCDAARSAGFEHVKTFQMPVNNLTLVLRRRDQESP